MSAPSKQLKDARDRASATLTEALSAFEQLGWLFNQLLEHDELPQPVYTVASMGMTITQAAQDRVLAEIDALVKAGREALEVGHG